MPTWAKAFLGCGVVAMLAVGSCVGVGVYRLRVATEKGKAQWPVYVQTVKDLMDPAATRALYEANPRLDKRYGDAEAFEKQVAEWRPAIQIPPAEMPPLISGQAISFQGRHTRVGPHRINRLEGGVSGYKMADGRLLVVVWEEGQIVSIEFQNGNP